MAQTIKLKRSATSGAVPTTASLELGEMAINTHDGKVYIKKDDGTEAVVEVGDTSGYLPLAGGTLTGALKVEGGSYSSGIDTATISLAVDRGDYIYSDDGSYLRRILGHTTGGAIEIGQGGTSLINSINLLPGVAGTAKVNGNTIWNAGNDGSGSGLDADLLDGQQGSYYAPASHVHSYLPLAGGTMTGTLDLGTQNINVDTNKGFVNSGSWTRNQTPYGYIDFGPANAGHAHIYTDRPTFYFNKELSVNGASVWHSGNDGSGSGLDADTVDGLQGSSFLQSTNDRVYITDSRGTQRAPSYYDDRYAQWDFQNNADTLAGGDLWNALQTVAPWSVYNNGHRQQQLAWTGSGGLKFRYATSESAWAGWQTLWTSGNDGSGSGLDADLLDGVQGSGYVNTTGTQIIGGAKYFNNILAVTGSETGGYAVQQITSSSVSTYPRIEFGYTGQTSRGRLQYNNTGDSMAFYTATAERMRISSAGNLGINEANPTYLIHTNSPTPTSGTQNHFKFIGNYGGIEARNYYGTTYMGNPSGGRGIQITFNGLAPGRSDTLNSLDNTLDLGFSYSRWDDVYATNGTIQTSDEREKQDISEIDDAEQRVAVAAKGLLRKFRWKESVAEKGDEARTHFGIMAQDLQAAFVAEGLDPSDYAMFIKTEWWVGDKTHPATPDELDEDGNVIVEGAAEHTEENHTYNNEADAPSDATYHYRLGIRYSELLAFIIAAM